MELIGISLPIVAWFPIFVVAAGLACVVYGFAVFMIGLVVRFFWGLDAENNFVDIAVKPLEVIWNVGDALRAAIAIPFRIRRKTVFAEVFGFRPEGLFHQEEWDQKIVDDKLQELASAFKRACDRQEAHRSWDRDQIVKEAKAAFWRAHNIAKHLGFGVRYSYTEYWPKETLAREGALA